MVGSLLRVGWWTAVTVDPVVLLVRLERSPPARLLVLVRGDANGR